MLDAKNPHYEGMIDVWKQCNALFRGGEYFKALLTQFLPQNPQEPIDVYETRRSESAYLNYLGPIVSYFVSWLFSGEFQLRAKDAKTDKLLDTDAKYTAFQADVGGDVNLNEFMRARMTDALVKQCGHWLIQLPLLDENDAQRIADQSMPALEYDERGLGQATLVPIQREQIYDWACDEYGKLQWCIIRDIQSIRNDPRLENREMLRETWRIYDREFVETFVYEYKDGQRSKDSKLEIASIGKLRHRFRELPLVTLDVGEGLWIGDRVREPQIEHFRLSVAKSWLIRRTCYAMPVLKVEDPSQRPDVMGAGYYLMLGLQDSFDWTAPPNTPFDVIQKSIDGERDEIYRVVHQMAQGLDNNADTVGRSADSKQIDTATTRIMLNAFGALVRRAIEETIEILSDALGDDDVFWAVEGLSGYDTATAAELIANATDAQLLGIPSKTFRQEIKIKTALAMLPEADPSVREAIRREIREAVDAMPDLEELELPVLEETKVKVQELKNETAEKIQEKKSEDVLVEAQMAARTPATDRPNMPTLPDRGFGKPTS